MKKFIIGLLLLALIFLLAAGAFVRKFSVDYHGQKDMFRDAQDEYKAGTTVRLIFEEGVKDTQYTFHVEGAEFTAEWSVSNSAYVIKFKMPKHDVEVYAD